jgi:hypothetical protein
VNPIVEDIERRLNGAEEPLKITSEMMMEAMRREISALRAEVQKSYHDLALVMMGTRPDIEPCAFEFWQNDPRLSEVEIRACRAISALFYENSNSNGYPLNVSAAIPSEEHLEDICAEMEEQKGRQN